MSYQYEKYVALGIVVMPALIFVVVLIAYNARRFLAKQGFKKIRTLPPQVEAVLRPIEGKIKQPSMHQASFGRSGRPAWFVHYGSPYENVDDLLVFVAELPSSYGTRFISNQLTTWRLFITSSQDSVLHPLFINDAKALLQAEAQSKKYKYGAYVDGAYIVLVMEGGEKISIHSHHVLGAVKKQIVLFGALLDRLLTK